MCKDGILKTLIVATGVCVVCSVFVSTAAVVLNPIQALQKTLDKKKNILSAAGVELKGDVEKLFKENIHAEVIDLETGEPAEGIDVATLDERKAAKDPALSIPVDDLPGIRRVSRYKAVYRTQDGKRLILPVHGKGLWSTMYGFLALDASDLDTIKSFSFYEHGETPGLGGEVDNPRWKKKWVGKEAFDEEGDPAVTVIKGTAPPDDPHRIDGLSGATITSRGVGNLVQFWLGPEGYGPFLEKQKEGVAGG
jgi:Na+-transporting NADH:ubiquinone oxidoreductase subunit C